MNRRLKLTREQWKELMTLGWRFKPAGLYEPDHAPRGTQFVIIAGLGLYRVTDRPVEKV